jgi:hypothetical protein
MQEKIKEVSNKIENRRKIEVKLSKNKRKIPRRINKTQPSSLKKRRKVVKFE